jgi:hypothetical protein
VSRRRRVAAVLAALLAAGLLLWLFAGGDDDEPRRGPDATAPAPGEDERASPGEAREGSEEPRCRESPGRLEVAVQDNVVLVGREYGDRDGALGQITELGTSWVKVMVLWSRVVPRPESREPPADIRYDFGKHDSAVDAVTKRGLCVEFALTGPAPAWATADGRVGAREPDADRFAGFARAAAEHFRGRVTRYSIWNEPNHTGWISPQGSAPGIYRGLYEAGYEAIKEVDPSAQVLIGETAAYARPGASTAPLEFLRELACRDRDYQPVRECDGLEADGYAHHPYDFDHAPGFPYPGRDNATLGTLDHLTEALDRLADEGALVTPEGRPLPLYLTEFGYFATGRRRVPAARRADWLAQAFELARRNPRVRQMLQYLLVQPPPDFPGGRFNTGIVKLNGRPGPAYRALAEWAAGARERGQIVVPRNP